MKRNYKGKIFSKNKKPNLSKNLRIWYNEKAENSDPPPIPDLEEVGKEIWDSIDSRTSTYLNKKSKNKRLTIYAKISGIVAAAIILIVFSVNFLPHFKSSSISILPGTTLVHMSLPSGQTVLISDLENNIDEIINKYSPEQVNGDIEFYVPKGAEYSFTLSDSSKIWLNNTTSIRVPYPFDHEKREVVLLDGEAYFNIHHHDNSTFSVRSGESIIEVLGTEFNVNTQADQLTRTSTTLVEGIIRVVQKDNINTLLPGQKAFFTQTEFELEELSPDQIRQETAWQKGYFEFEDMNIEKLLDMIGKWYQVDIKYVNNQPQRKLTGKIPRSSDFNDILAILDFYNINHKVEKKALLIF